MKLVSIALACFLWTSAYAQDWGPDTRLTNQSGVSENPSVAVSGDNIHVAWNDYRDSNLEIYYKCSLDNGGTWGSDTRLTNQDDESVFPSVAVSGDNIHVVWQDDRDENDEIYYKRSLDNGGTWGSDTRLTNQDDVSGFPSVAVSGDNIHVVWQDFHDGNFEIYYKRSLDNGGTWGSDTRLTNQDDGSGLPSVAVSGDNIHVVWYDNRDGNFEIYYKRSLDNGGTWGSDARLTNQDRTSEYPSVAVSGNNIHVVWVDDRDGNDEIYYKRSLDNGGIWGSDTRLTDQDDGSRIPSVAVSGDNIHVVWYDNRDTDFEIYYKRSLDNGGIWGSDTRLTDQDDGSRIPSVAVSGDNIHVVWYDDRDTDWEIYYKHGREEFSPDGQIKNSSDVDYVGNNIYNNDGTGQTKEQEVALGTPAVFHIKIENDGANADNIKVTGTGGVSDWTVIYYDDLTGGTEITGDVTGGGWFTGVLLSDDSKEIRVEVTPALSASGSYEVLVTGTSLNAVPEKKDVVKAITTAEAGIEEDIAQNMKDYSISLLFQNPSYNRSVIRYSLPERERISLLIYDISGRIVRTLIRAKSQEPGVYTVVWDGCDDNGMRLPSGVYFYQLKTMHSSLTKNMVFMR